MMHAREALYLVEIDEFFTQIHFAFFARNQSNAAKKYLFFSLFEVHSWNGTERNEEKHETWMEAPMSESNVYAKIWAQSSDFSSDELTQTEHVAAAISCLSDAKQDDLLANSVRHERRGASFLLC